MNSSTSLLPIEKYREMLDLAPVCTVDVLFFNEDKSKTLLFRRTNNPLKGNYFSIGGRLLKNEKLEDGAVRQALKETGLHIKKAGLTFGGIQEELHPVSIFNGVSYHAVDIFYGYILTDEAVTLDTQHDDYRWFSISDETLHPFIESKIRSLLKTYG